MQDRYVGDIGDFGKLGLLRQLSACGMAIGVNWYLTPNESHNTDGRYVGYLNDDTFRACDEPLWLALKQVVSSEQRTVSALEAAEFLPAADTRYNHRMLLFSNMSKQERQSARAEWHHQALNALCHADLVFVDPDNGLIVPSAEGTAKSNKFVLPSELEDYYQRGASVVYYQHQARRPDSFYITQHKQLLSSEAFRGATGFGIKFVTTSRRYYFFILQPRHKGIIFSRIETMLETPWGHHFKNITDLA